MTVSAVAVALRRRPITLREARRFVGEHHRHNGSTMRGWLFGVGVFAGDELVGVGIASRPTARMLDDGATIEIQRCCTTGAPNACTMIYGGLCRAAAALGYARAVTYTLASERGSSLRAAGFEIEAELPSRGYGGGRDRYERTLLGDQVRPEEAKHRWARRLGP